MNSSLVAFLLGLGTRLQVQVIGYLPLSEIAILLASPFLLSRMTSRDALRPTRLLLPMALLWTLNTIVSDVVNQTQWSLAARGLARPVVFIFCIPFCSWFFSSDTRRKLLWFFIGCIPSLVLSAYVLRGGVHEGRAITTGAVQITWESHWCGVPYVITLAIMLLYYRVKPARGYLAGLFTGALNIYMGSRSAGGVMILGVGSCLARNLTSSRRAIGRLTLRKMTPLQAIPAMIVLAMVAIITLEGYKWAAQSGALGNRARAKYEMQVRGKYGLVATGRADAFAGLLAIAESPLVGYGSWPADKKGFYTRMCEFFEMKPEKNHYSTGYPLIPSHSHLTQAWVQNGVFGGLFWGYVLYVLALSFFRPMLHERELRMWACAVSMSTAWAVLFSPISDRLTTALVLAVLAREMVPLATAVLHPVAATFGPRAMAWKSADPHDRVGA